MRVFDGDSAPDKVAGDAYGGAEGKNRADRGGLDNDPVQVQGPFGADVEGVTDKAGGASSSDGSPLQSGIEVNAACQPV